MAHPGHSIIRCECGIMLGQCRCATPGKTLEIVRPCTHVPTPVPTPNAPEYLTVKREDIFSTTSAYDAIDCVYYPLTWREVARQQAERITELERFRSICLDLDRCEHGRHEGDVCDGCNGASVGNRLIGHGPIGHGISREHIFVPFPSAKHDAERWRVHGPCRGPDQDGACPIGPVRRSNEI